MSRLMRSYNILSKWLRPLDYQIILLWCVILFIFDFVFTVLKGHEVSEHL